MDTPADDANPIEDAAADDAPAVPTPAVPPVAAWYPDPARRYQFRYWDGAAWTANVATNGITAWDPPYTDHPGTTTVPPAIPGHDVTSTTPPVAPPPSPTTAIPASAPWSEGGATLRRTSTLATVLGWALAITSGATITRFVAAINRIVVVRTADSWDESRDPAPIIRRLQSSDDFLDITAALLFLAWLVILVLLVVWMYRSARNDRDLGRWDNGLTPGWTIGGWIVPVANWFVPASLMQSIWRGAETEPRTGTRRRRSAAIGLWWVTYLVGVIVMTAGFGPTTDEASSAQELYNYDTATIVACVLVIVSALVLRGSVLAIQRRTRELTNDAV